MQKERKTLRLLLFKDCNRDCPLCCNKQWDLSKLEVERDFTPYKEIVLTGGEPLLRPEVVYRAIGKIKQQTGVPIFLYTAMASRELAGILAEIQGLTFTLHDQGDVGPFKIIKGSLQQYGKSLQLNVFEGIDLGDLELSKWVVKKEIKWLKECPLPENEVFKRFE